MPKPRRRRRFFALEGRLEVDDLGELQGLVEEEPPDREPTPASVASEASERLEAPADGGTALPTAFRLERLPRTHPQAKARVSFRPVWLVLTGLVLGVPAGYFGSSWIRKPADANAAGKAPQATTVLTPADENDLDAAYAARLASHYAEAERLFNELAHRHPGWGPMEIELGRTFSYENHSFNAYTILKSAVERGVAPAEANFLLGLLNRGRGNYPAADTNFALAVSIDPTRPEYYFFWGECLRAEGKLLEAVSRFRSALLRNQSEAEVGLYRAKLWLSEIEADQETHDGTSAEIDAALAQPHPTVDALIAAAARDIKAGRFDAAASHLRRARRRADPDVFTYLMWDSFFTAMRERPELAEVFRDTPPAPIPAASPPAGFPNPSLPLNELAPAPAVRPVNSPPQIH